jgi:hypothetical protein
MRHNTLYDAVHKVNASLTAMLPHTFTLPLPEDGLLKVIDYNSSTAQQLNSTRESRLYSHVRMPAAQLAYTQLGAGRLCYLQCSELIAVQT